MAVVAACVASISFEEEVLLRMAPMRMVMSTLITTPRMRIVTIISTREKPDSGRRGVPRARTSGGLFISSPEVGSRHGGVGSVERPPDRHDDTLQVAQRSCQRCDVVIPMPRVVGPDVIRGNAGGVASVRQSCICPRQGPELFLLLAGQIRSSGA